MLASLVCSRCSRPLMKKYSALRVNSARLRLHGAWLVRFQELLSAGFEACGAGKKLKCSDGTSIRKHIEVYFICDQESPAPKREGSRMRITDGCN